MDSLTQWRSKLQLVTSHIATFFTSFYSALVSCLLSSSSPLMLPLKVSTSVLRLVLFFSLDLMFFSLSGCFCFCFYYLYLIIQSFAYDCIDIEWKFFGFAWLQLLRKKKHSLVTMVNQKNLFLITNKINVA